MYNITALTMYFNVLQVVLLHIPFTYIVAVLVWSLAILVCGQFHRGNFHLWPFWMSPINFTHTRQRSKLYIR